MPGQQNYPYKKSVDITAWIFQFALSLIIIGLSAFLLAVDNNGSSFVHQNGGGLVALSVLTVIIDIVEIILMRRKALPPALYLACACTKTLFSVISIVLGLTVLGFIGIAFSSATTAAALAQVVQGAIIIHKKRQESLVVSSYAKSIDDTASVSEMPHN
ncbi:hypothetical protein GGR50DRAFT_550542 [Xylaria sp. CBS 124048]|nr:hypothetical protein GGR50DRAFT_550542 [Xylaria sp. CBS 124048]